MMDVDVEEDCTRTVTRIPTREETQKLLCHCVISEGKKNVFTNHDPDDGIGEKVSLKEGAEILPPKDAEGGAQEGERADKEVQADERRRRLPQDGQGEAASGQGAGLEGVAAAASLHDAKDWRMLSPLRRARDAGSRGFSHLGAGPKSAGSNDRRGLTFGPK